MSLPYLLNDGLIFLCLLLCWLGKEWQAIVHMPQHMPKIILGALLLHTLDIKIACLIPIFNLVLILHAPRPPPPPKKSVLL